MTEKRFRIKVIAEALGAGVPLVSAYCREHKISTSAGLSVSQVLQIARAMKSQGGKAADPVEVDELRALLRVAGAY